VKEVYEPCCAASLALDECLKTATHGNVCVFDGAALCMLWFCVFGRCPQRRPQGVRCSSSLAFKRAGSANQAMPFTRSPGGVGKQDAGHDLFGGVGVGHNESAKPVTKHACVLAVQRGASRFGCNFTSPTCLLAICIAVPNEIAAHFAKHTGP
jgi:hypothetical protein